MLDVYLQLAGPCTEQISLGADHVADIQNLKQPEIIRADGIAPDIDLELLAILRKVREPGFALAANGLHASSDTDLEVRGKFCGGFGTVFGQDLRNAVREIVAFDISAISQALDLAYTRTALLKQLIFKGQSAPLLGEIGYYNSDDRHAWTHARFDPLHFDRHPRLQRRKTAAAHPGTRDFLSF